MKTIVGYADRLGAAPGETLSFMVHCDRDGVEAYSARLVRLYCTDDSPLGPGLTEVAVPSSADGRHAARRQVTRVGSYATVPMQGPEKLANGLTMQALVFPTRLAAGEQTIMAWRDPVTGMGISLGIGNEGRLCAGVSDGQHDHVVALDGALRERTWYSVAVCHDPAKQRLTLAQRALGTADEQDEATAEITVGMTVTPRPHTPLSLAADLTLDGTARHFNGKIERPRLSGCVLDTAALVKAGDEDPAVGSHLLGAWDFSLEIQSERIVDVSGNNRDGFLTNMPTRAVTGAAWTGEVHDWKTRPDHYAAIHFHDDDLDDCRWEVDFTLALPDDLPSGVYAMRLDDGGAPEHVVFFVRPPRGTATAPVAYLVSTCTYLAYGNYRTLERGPLTEATQGALAVFNHDDLYLNAHPDLGDSLYGLHSDGSGVCYSSGRRPLLNMRPNGVTWCFNGDGFLVGWLDAIGQAVDVITEEDLHAEGAALLSPYRVVITGCHPEYTTTAMWDALKSYCDEGGRFMYLGGNGFYWRVGFVTGKEWLMEVRRAEDGARAWVSEPGEYYMSSTGEYGGLWRRLGRPPNRLVGVGFVAQGFDSSSYYVRRPDSFDTRAAFVFEGIGDEERIGNFGIAGGGAAGQEIDATNIALGTPPGTLVLAASEDHSEAMLVTKEEFRSTPLFVDATVNPVARAEIVLFPTARGGAVFSTGSISWVASLPIDGWQNNVARITGNVLARFLDPAPLAD